MLSSILQYLKKFTAEVLVVSLVLLVLQPRFANADGSLAISYEFPANSGITASKISYILETTSGAVVRASNTQTIVGLSAGTYQLRITSVPSGFVVTNSPHPIPVNINNNETSTVSVVIKSAESAGLTGLGILATNVTFPTGGQFGTTDIHLVLETFNGAKFAEGSIGNINNIPTGSYYVRVDKVPTGHAVANTVHPIPVTISGSQTTSLTITILPQNQVPQRTVGDLVVSYSFSPEGVKTPDITGFHFIIQNADGGVIAAGNQGTLYHLPVGNFKLTMDLLPKNFKVDNAVSPIPVSIIAGAKTTVTVLLKDTSATAPTPAPAKAPATEKAEPATNLEPEVLGTSDVKSAVDEIACAYGDTVTLSVKYLCQLGIIDAPTLMANYQGESKGFRYNGDAMLTRAEFVKMMILITYDEEEIEGLSAKTLGADMMPFPDVPTNAWYSQYVIVAKNEDHVHGYPDGNFVPWNPIRMSEALKILFNTSRHDNEKVSEDLATTLEVIGEGNDWYMPYAVLAQTYGGFTPELNRPHGEIYNQQVTRQQAADIIYTIIQNAGLEPSTKSRLSNLKERLTMLQTRVAL